MFIKKEKSTASISRVLYLLRGVCHLSTPQVALRLKHSTLHRCLRIGRTALKRWYTRTCSPQMEQPGDRPPAGGLLHHLLTLTLVLVRRKRRSFSSLISSCRQLLALSPVECPVLPGLSSRAPMSTSDRPRHCFQRAKVIFLMKNEE